MTQGRGVGLAEVLGWALGGFARAVARHRRGVVAAVVVYVAVAISSEIPSDALAVGLVVLAVLLAVPPTRRALWRPVGRWWLRRRWRLGCVHAGLVTPAGRVPVPRRMRAVPCGELMRVKVPAGSHAGDLAARAETLAAFLGVREVRVSREASNARYARVTVVKRDPLAGGTPLAWPNLSSSSLSLWEPIPVGVDEEGQWVTVSLAERNLLLGGEPGAGKSVALSMPVATAALDPSVRLTLLDGKLVELAIWRGCAERFAGVDVQEAIQVLRQLQAEMDARYRFLLSHGRRKVSQGDGLPLHVVCCDELAHYLTAGDRRQTAEFATVLRDLVSRGRAAGVIVLAATQKPSHDVIPTSLRDLFGFRWALRCSTPQASDTILGAGWASMGYSAATIDAADRGVGFLLHEGGQPARMKACYLSDSDLASLAARGEELRRSHAEHAGPGEGEAALA